MSQSKEILNWMRTVGPITAITALNEFGCLRLAARISDLRLEGHKIKAVDVVTPSRKRVAEYSLEHKA